MKKTPKPTKITKSKIASKATPKAASKVAPKAKEMMQEAPSEKTERVAQKVTSPWLIVTSLLFGLFGIGYLFLALVLLMYPGIASFGLSPVAITIIIGLSSAVCFVAAVGIWKAKRYGAITGAIFMALNLISGLPSLVTAPSPGTFIGVIIEALVLVLIYVEWKKFS